MTNVALRKQFKFDIVLFLSFFSHSFLVSHSLSSIDYYIVDIAHLHHAKFLGSTNNNNKKMFKIRRKKVRFLRYLIYLSMSKYRNIKNKYNICVTYTMM